MGKRTPSFGDTSGTVEIDLNQIARMAMESNPLTESEARAALEQAAQQLYPDLELAADVLTAVWHALKFEAEAEHRDLLQVLRSAATDGVPRVLRLNTRPVVISQTVTVGSDGPRPGRGKLIFAMPLGWLYIASAFILGTIFAILVYAIVSHLILGK